MRQHHASFVNVICRFGDKVLLDYAKEIVIPAFTDNSLIRKYGSTTYFFHDVKIQEVSLADNEFYLVLSGRFIKNTKLKREQVFDRSVGIVRDEAELASAPSAFFALILNNHRLAFMPETAHAPTVENFEATLIKFLKMQHKKYIDHLYQWARVRGEKVTKLKLIEHNPAPSLEAIPISGDEQIEEFMRRYGILKRVEFKILRPNHELDTATMFNEIRDVLIPIDPIDLKLSASNSSGLDIEKAIPRVKKATETGNQRVKLSGLDQDGVKLNGDNEKFKISAPVDPVPSTRNALVKKLISIFESLVASGAIKIAKQVDNVKEKIDRLR